jgi:hypothetical protein
VGSLVRYLRRVLELLFVYAMKRERERTLDDAEASMSGSLFCSYCVCVCVCVCVEGSERNENNRLLNLVIIVARRERKLFDARSLANNLTHKRHKHTLLSSV